MRITIINQFYRPDLAPTAALSASLAESLAQAGHDVTVVASRGGYVSGLAGARASDPNPGVRVFRLWTPRLGKGSVLKRLADYLAYYLLAAWTLLRQPQQDVLISLTTPPFIVLTALLHRGRHPASRVVLWNMDCYPEAPERVGMLRPGGIVSRLLRRINRFIFQSVDHVVCLDTAMRDLLQSTYGCPREFPCSIIPNWEPLALFPKRLDPADGPLADPVKPLTVLYLGNTGVGHEFETVLECARLLRDQPVAFRFVGGGKWWNWLADQSAALDLPGWKVEPYIPKELTPGLLATADVALITLRDSSLGVMSPSKLHGNLAAGLPVLYIGPVGSNVDEAIARFGCGVSVRNGDAEQAAGFLRALLADRAMTSRLKLRARSAFEQAYCDEQTVPMFARLLDAVTAPASVPLAKREPAGSSARRAA